MPVTDEMAERWKQADNRYHRRRLETILYQLETLEGDLDTAIDEMTNDGTNHVARIETRFARRRLRTAALLLQSAMEELG